MEFHLGVGNGTWFISVPSWVSRPTQPSSVFQLRSRLPVRATTGGRLRKGSSGFPPCCCLPAVLKRCGGPQETVSCRNRGPGNGAGPLRVPPCARVAGLWSCCGHHVRTQRHRSASSRTRPGSTRVHPRRSGRSCGPWPRFRGRGSGPADGLKSPPGGTFDSVTPLFPTKRPTLRASTRLDHSAHRPICAASRPAPTAELPAQASGSI